METTGGGSDTLVVSVCVQTQPIADVPLQSPPPPLPALPVVSDLPAVVGPPLIVSCANLEDFSPPRQEPYEIGRTSSLGATARKKNVRIHLPKRPSAGAMHDGTSGVRQPSKSVQRTRSMTPLSPDLPSPRSRKVSRKRTSGLHHLALYPSKEAPIPLPTFVGAKPIVSIPDSTGFLDAMMRLHLVILESKKSYPVHPPYKAELETSYDFVTRHDMPPRMTAGEEIVTPRARLVPIKDYLSDDADRSRPNYMLRALHITQDDYYFYDADAEDFDWVKRRNSLPFVDVLTIDELEYYVTVLERLHPNGVILPELTKVPSYPITCLAPTAAYLYWRAKRHRVGNSLLPAIMVPLPTVDDNGFDENVVFRKRVPNKKKTGDRMLASFPYHIDLDECDICKLSSTTENNDLVLCDGPCGRWFHQWCYGISFKELTDDWYCNECALEMRMLRKRDVCKVANPSPNPESLTLDDIFGEKNGTVQLCCPNPCPVPIPLAKAADGSHTPIFPTLRVANKKITVVGPQSGNKMDELVQRMFCLPDRGPPRYHVVNEPTCVRLIWSCDHEAHGRKSADTSEMGAWLSMWCKGMIEKEDLDSPVHLEPVEDSPLKKKSKQPGVSGAPTPCRVTSPEPGAAPQSAEPTNGAPPDAAPHDDTARQTETVPPPDTTAHVALVHDIQDVPVGDEPVVVNLTVDEEVAPACEQHESSHQRKRRRNNKDTEDDGIPLDIPMEIVIGDSVSDVMEEKEADDKRRPKPNTHYKQPENTVERRFRFAKKQATVHMHKSARRRRRSHELVLELPSDSNSACVVPSTPDMADVPPTPPRKVSRPRKSRKTKAPSAPPRSPLVITLSVDEISAQPTMAMPVTYLPTVADVSAASNVVLLPYVGSLSRLSLASTFSTRGRWAVDTNNVMRKDWNMHLNLPPIRAGPLVFFS